MNKAKAGFGGMFVIGLVFTIIGISTGDAGFYAPGIVFLVVGLGAAFYPSKSKQASDQDPDGPSP